MIDRVIKLGLSAFNVQCDNEILDVSFDNIDRSDTKLNKIRENVDKLLEPNRCKITQEFFMLKLEELRLAYEYKEKVHKEKEEQKALREQMKEEERARREAEKAQAEAEREEKRFADALDKARKELASKSEADREQYSVKIKNLEEQLRLAMENKERAKSMAEQTRKGHVYIISNIGSFGEHVYKIGMTRRLDPLDRIWELSDASVPFDFDIHALVQSDDAPGLERKLHESFSSHRVNRVNEKKEFFRVELSKIAEACKQHHNLDIKLTLVAEAKEYRQTAALLSAGAGASTQAEPVST
jgi:chemotaxis protein histidine kinase CheA